MLKDYYVYILASRRYGTLYVGSTNNPAKRIYEHKQGFVQCFTSKYEVNKLVYLSEAISWEESRLRERQIKKWRRQWKINLIEKENPNWEDLYYKLF